MTVGKSAPDRRPVVVVLPVHDEAATLVEVIRRVPPVVHGRPVQVVVVDDGSTDGSGDLAVAAGAQLVSHDRCRGLGAAVRTGFHTALRLDAWAVAFLDADGEYDPAELHRVLSPIASGEADYVVGSRFAGRIEAMRLHRRVGNRLLTLVTSLAAGRRLTDAQSGFRALGRAALEAAEIAHDYNYAQVLTQHLVGRGLRYAEVPIRYRRRAHGRSFVKLGRYLRLVLPAMARVWWRNRRPGPLLAGIRLPLVVFAVVLVAGQLGVGMRASRTSAITGDEPFYVLTAQSLVSDGDLDLRDEYAGEEYRSWWQADGDLWQQMTPTSSGRLLSPHDPGLPLLIAPAFALAGVEGAQRLLAVLWAAAMGCAAVVARRCRMRDWSAAAAAVVVGAGVPGAVYASQLYPEGPAALAVAVALGVTTSPRARPLLFVAVLTGLAWLGVKYVPVGVVLAAAWAWRFRTERRALLLAGILAAAAGTHYLVWHLQTFGGLTPYSVNLVWAGRSDAAIVADHLDWQWRSYRLYGLFLDARFGLFRWLPAAVVAVFGLRRHTLQPAAVFAVGVLVGTFASITIMGWWFPGRLLIAGFAGLVVLVAAGWERFPRAGGFLAAWSLAVAAALVWSAKHGGVHLAVDPFELAAPLPPRWAFPDFRSFGASEILRSLVWGLVLAVTAASLHPAGGWRRRLTAGRRPGLKTRTSTPIG